MWLRLYAYGLVGSVYLDQFLWFVYLLRLGYSPAAIGVAYAVMQAVRFALDVPSSMLSDRFGQRPLLVLASLLKAVSSVLFLLAAHGFAFVVVGSAVTAMALTLPSGVDLSYVRSLSDRDPHKAGAERLQFRLSRYMGMQALAGLAAGVIGGAIASWSFPLLYQLDAAIGLVAAAIAQALPNLRPPRAPAAFGATRAALWHGLREVAAARPAFWQLALLIIPLWTFSSVGTEYTQALLLRVGLQPFGISLAFAGAGLAAWFGTLASGGVTERRRSAVLRAIVWLYPLSALVRSLAVPGRGGARVAGISGIFVGRLGSGASGVLVNTALLDRAPEDHRATALSAVNTLQMACMLVLFPVLGLVAGREGVAFAFALLAGGLAVVAIGLQFALRRGDGEPLAPRTDRVEPGAEIRR